MNKKLISLLVAICLVIGLLPVMSIATETVTSQTISLGGQSVTVDTDDTTTDIPAAIYWINNKTKNAVPTALDPTVSEDAAKIAAGEWNYYFTIVDGVPTLTLKNSYY